MCRMLVAVGYFDHPSLVRAAHAMSIGVRAPEKAPVKRHQDGWGALHQAFGGCRRVRRSGEGLCEADAAAFEQSRPGVFMVHARHATLKTYAGVEFAHPLERGELAFAHNGFVPNAVRHLGRDEGSFDTAALFDLIAPPEEREPSVGGIVDRLDAMGKGGSANSFLISSRSVTITNWFDGDPDYYTLWLMHDERGVVCASEMLPEIAPSEAWRPMGPRMVTRLHLEDFQ